MYIPLCAVAALDALEQERRQRMTELIERLAKEAGFDWLSALAGPDSKDKVTMYANTPQQLAKFAALVADVCADECEAQICADAIRSKFPPPEVTG